MTSLFFDVIFAGISLFFFFFNDTATTEIYTLSLHDALPICLYRGKPRVCAADSAHHGNSGSAGETRHPDLGWRPLRSAQLPGVVGADYSLRADAHAVGFRPRAVRHRQTSIHGKSYADRGDRQLDPEYCAGSVDGRCG